MAVLLVPSVMSLPLSRGRHPAYGVVASTAAGRWVMISPLEFVGPIASWMTQLARADSFLSAVDGQPLPGGY